MTIDNPGAVLSTVLHATISYVGTVLFCAVAEQPYWLAVACAAISAGPGLYRILNDHRLKHVTADRDREKRRADAAEAKLKVTS